MCTPENAEGYREMGYNVGRGYSHKGSCQMTLAEGAEGFQSGRRIIVCTGHGVDGSLSKRTSDKSDKLCNGKK